MRAYLIAVCLCLASFLLPASLAARQQDMSTTAFDFHFPSIEGGQLHLSDYQGKVLLVVNTASQCGFTPQYTALQTIWSEYRDKGLVVIGVPSDDFGGQELDSEQQVKEFCEVNFNITFPLILAIGWQVVAVSFGAFSILMYLLARSSASETVAWFYMVPPLAAFFSWLILDEELSVVDLLGFLIVSLGVFLATRVTHVGR